MKEDDIITMAKYARYNHLTSKPLWKWAAKYQSDPNKMILHVVKKAAGKKKFGPK